jgi:hypothetical protein
MRVLLIGAYANGNLGDAYQADAIARLVREIAPDASVASSSPSGRALPYPASNHEPLPRGVVDDVDALNEFDLILVGGGGLLAAKHRPLNEAAWVEGISVPLCAVSVGVAAPTADLCAPFIQRCDLFSVRDGFSFAAAAPYRDDLVITKDALLVESSTRRPPTSRDSVLWVPGKLTEASKPFYRRLRETGIIDTERDTIASFNEASDRNSGFEETFGDGVRYLTTLPQFDALASSTEFVVSERYHGCIFSLRAGAACLGLALRARIPTSKTVELFSDLRMPEALIRIDDPLDRSALTALARGQIEHRQVASEFMAVEREKLREYLRGCVRRASAHARRGSPGPDMDFAPSA